MATLTARTLSGTPTSIDWAAIDQLAANLSIPPILASGAEYDEARKVFNAMIDKRPALIVRCREVADVIQSVTFAREHELVVAVRGGGHNVAGFATCDDGLVIDLSEMKGIRVNVERRTVRAEGGATWGDLDRQTQVFGLATPGGAVSTTGIGGLTLGGGQGWLRRTFGMTCDNLLSADVVTADARFLNVNETEHPDLFWALKGGGGNFGVVTSFEYRLHPVGPLLAFAGPVYSTDKARQVLHGFREFVSNAPDEINALAVLWTIPESPVFPQHLHGREILMIGATYSGPTERGDELLRPLRELAEPILDWSAPIQYQSLQQLFDPFFRKGEFLHYWKAIYLDNLNTEVVEEIVAGFARRSSPRSMVAVWALGGALARVGADDTPVGSRAAPFLLEIIGSWNNPDHTELGIAWAREVFEAMHRFSSGKTNLNFSGLDEDNERFVRAAFGAHYGRLAAVKKKYDPMNMFRLNQNILPAEADEVGRAPHAAIRS